MQTRNKMLTDAGKEPDCEPMQVVDLALTVTLVEAGHAIGLENLIRDYHAAVHGLGAAAAAALTVQQPLSGATEPHENSVVPPTTG